MAEVVLAGVLGAAILAIVLLYKNSQRQADRLTKLEAELAAEKIARITQQPVPIPPPADVEEPEPARRKRHLALYIGGGVAAILASLGDRLRSLARGRRSAVVTAAASSVLVATSAVAYYANAGDDATPDSTGNAPSATAPDFGINDDQAPEQGARDDEGEDGKNGDNSSGTELAFIGQGGITGDEHPEASQREDSDQGADSDQERPGDDASGTPTPTAPTKTQPSAKSPAPSTSGPEPSQPPTTEPDDDEPDDVEPGDDDGLCIGVPPLLELCASKGR